jgi:hypothetical protein
MNQLQRLGHWLVSFLQFLLKNLIPFLTVLVAFVSLRVSIFGLTSNQIIVLILGLLAVNALVERFLSLQKIEREIFSFTNTHMPRIENAIESVALTNVAFQLGIAGITTRWTDFIEFTEPFGEHFKEHLLQVKAPATWYVVTITPEGFLPWRPLFESAVEDRGIDIKWVYQPWETLNVDPAIKTQALMFFGQVPTWDDRIKALKGQWERADAELKRWVEQSELRLKTQRKVRSGSWELYESCLPHFYLAFLSVPKKHQNIRLQDPAPHGTFGFVHLYLMFPSSSDARPAICFEAPGLLTDTYYRSILSMFDEHINRGYVRRKHPQDEAGAAQV